jgi:RNA polymerase sigma-70 factor (ECF subfamily)
MTREPAASFEALFRQHFLKLQRYLSRMSGDPELAADLAQEAFVKLHRRSSLPDVPEAWLITVSTNLLRNARARESRRRRLLTEERSTRSLADPPPAPDAADPGESARVRRALAALPERERSLLLLRAEGYGYREIAAALELNEASVGTLLARAKQAFLERYEGRSDAS